MRVIKLAALLLITMCAFSMYTLAAAVAEDYSLYLSESECVREHIAAGVPRNMISTGRGTCTVE